MEIFEWLWSWVMWLIGLARPENLKEIVNLGGPFWVSYLILFAIIFAETGLLVGFFLPGDSLLFAAGFLARGGVFDFLTLNLVLMVAAVVGDAVNYWLGAQMGEMVFERGRLKFVKHEHLIAAKVFYEKYGGRAIILARFVPIVRTFTPFVAGVARMKYSQFVAFNVLGGIGWVFSMSLLGYLLGSIPWVERHFEKVIVLIVVVSVLPVVIETYRHSRRKKPVEIGPEPVSLTGS